MGMESLVLTSCAKRHTVPASSILCSPWHRRCQSMFIGMACCHAFGSRDGSSRSHLYFCLLQLHVRVVRLSDERAATSHIALPALTERARTAAHRPGRAPADPTKQSSCTSGGWRQRAASLALIVQKNVWLPCALPAARRTWPRVGRRRNAQ